LQNLRLDRHKNIGAKNLAIFVTDVIGQRLLYETLVLGQTTKMKQLHSLLILMPMVSG
jgi:hypothetical protein